MTTTAKAFLLLLVTAMARGSLADAESDKTPCSQRCDRLFARSLDRIKTNARKIEAALKGRKPIEKLKDVCWKFEDFEDCHAQCEHPKSVFFSSDAMRKNLYRKCRPPIAEQESHFKCISKFHSFLEIRCSTYAKEATFLREKSKGNDEYRQETCRYLHYHNRCLTNNVFIYCPQAKNIFNRFTLREFFLSFVVPPHDELFSDSFLDFCQIFDFAKMAQEIYDSTTKNRNKSASTVSYESTSRSEESSTERTAFSSRLFSPYEDLADSPPNFYYSSQRAQKTTRPYRVFQNASEIHHYDREEDSTKSANVEIEIMTHPVTVHFEVEPETSAVPGVHETASNSVEEPEDPLAFFPDEKTHNTVTPTPRPLSLDANQILSTIFRFPGIFPTTPVGTEPESPDSVRESGESKDVHRELAEILAGIDEESSTAKTPTTTPQAATVGFGRPYLSGTKVHIKPIRRWNEPDAISDEEAYDESLVLLSSSAEDGDDNLELELAHSNDTITPFDRALSRPTAEHIWTMLTIYAILFSIAFISLTCLVMFLIIRSRCKPRGKYVVQ